MTKWQTQAVNITTNQKVKVGFTLPDFRATKILTWNCHVGASTKIRYNMVLGRYILTVLVLNLVFPITPPMEVIYHLKGAHHPWSIWVHMN